MVELRLPNSALKAWPLRHQNPHVLTAYPIKYSHHIRQQRAIRDDDKILVCLRVHRERALNKQASTHLSTVVTWREKMPLLYL